MVSDRAATHQSAREGAVRRQSPPYGHSARQRSPRYSCNDGPSRRLAEFTAKWQEAMIDAGKDSRPRRRLAAERSNVRNFSSWEPKCCSRKYLGLLLSVAAHRFARRYDAARAEVAGSGGGEAAWMDESVKPRFA